MLTVTLKCHTQKLKFLKASPETKCVLYLVYKKFQKNCLLNFRSKTALSIFGRRKKIFVILISNLIFGDCSLKYSTA